MRVDPACDTMARSPLKIGCDSCSVDAEIFEMSLCVEQPCQVGAETKEVRERHREIGLPVSLLYQETTHQKQVSRTYRVYKGI